ncbi:unnamed protein product, partial [Strongylus vulgaris]
MDYSTMFQSSFYYTASYTTGFPTLPCFEDVRDAATPPMFLGLPMPTQPQYYSAFPPSYYQLTTPLPEYPQLPAYPTPAVSAFNTSHFSLTDVASVASTSYYSDTTTHDSWLEHSLTSVDSNDDVVSIAGDCFGSPETPQRFAGNFAPSYRGASPVLLYQIPSTDLCYVYNQIRTVDGSKGHYVCRECYLKKKYVPAK